MKALIVPSWYPIEENPVLGIFFKEQAMALKEFGVDVKVLFPEIRTLRNLDSKWDKGITVKPEDGVMTYRFKGYNYIPARVPYSNAFLFYNRLKRLYSEYVKRECKPDVIHAHSCLWGGWAAAKIASDEKIPLVLTEHSSKLGRGLLKSYEKAAMAATLSKADKIISVGPGLKDALMQMTDKEISEIPNIVDFQSFQEENFPGKSHGKFRFFSLALLTPNKGMDILIRSFAKAFKGGDSELFIGGNGPQLDELKSLAGELGVTEQITFLGALDRGQVARHMKECDAFVLASRYETFGVVLIEALAAGKPVISTDSGGPRSIINEKNGLLVEVDNIEELSGAMLSVKRDYSSYNPEVIMEDCRDKFSKEAIVHQLINVYNSVV